MRVSKKEIEMYLFRFIKVKYGERYIESADVDEAIEVLTRAFDPNVGTTVKKDKLGRSFLEIYSVNKSMRKIMEIFIKD